MNIYCLIYFYEFRLVPHSLIQNLLNDPTRPMVRVDTALYNNDGFSGNGQSNESGMI